MEINLAEDFVEFNCSIKEESDSISPSTDARVERTVLSSWFKSTIEVFILLDAESMALCKFGFSSAITSLWNLSSIPSFVTENLTSTVWENIFESKCGFCCWVYSTSRKFLSSSISSSPITTKHDFARFVIICANRLSKQYSWIACSKKRRSIVSPFDTASLSWFNHFSCPNVMTTISFSKEVPG